MEDKKYITQLYASTPRPTIKRTLVKIFKEYCYYQTGPPCRDDGSIFYVCKEKTTENIKCPGRGYLHNNVFYEIIGHNHPINENDNLRRLFKDEMFEVCLMFPNRSERLLYNEIIEEYTDEAQAFIRKYLPFENIKRCIVNWRSTNQKKDDKIEPRKRRKPKKYLNKDQEIKKE